MLTVLKRKIAASLTDFWNTDAEKILALFEKPKSEDHGHLSLPVFSLAKTLRKAPPQIAQEITAKIQAENFPELEAVSAVSGYVNFTIRNNYLLQQVFTTVKEKGDKLGHSVSAAGKKLVIDYSSPNVAKPMHIGHLRSAVIGQAIRNLAVTQGYEVIGLNHLGDWGSQFGKLCFAYSKWGKEFPFEKQPFESLYQLYVRFHKETEANPELESQGAAEFKKLEDGDPESVQLWQRFVQISIEEYEKLWSRLGIRFDLVRGESFYNDRLKPIEQELEQKGLLVESEGAMVVDLSDVNLPPCLIRKQDGASLYATRDLASADYRFNELGANVNLYVVGAEQKLHFEQVFAVLKKMGRQWAEQCHHIYFGLIRFKDIGKISSRKGQIIRLSDVLNEAVEKVREKISGRSQNLQDPEKVAEQVGVGAIVFNDLKNDRVKNIEFDWEQALSFEGDSGPYVQYVCVRCTSLLKKYQKTPELKLLAENISPEESRLANLLTLYPQILTASYQNFKPSLLANYLLDICGAFNRFYHHHRILEGDPALQDTRMSLVFCTREVISHGLAKLSVPTPEEM